MDTSPSAIDAVLDATRETDVDRVVIVGGAGSLKVDENTELLDTPDFPEEFREEVEAGREPEMGHVPATPTGPSVVPLS